MISTAAWGRLCCRGEHLLCHDPIRWPSAFSEAWSASLSQILARSFVPQGTGFRVGTTHLEPLRIALARRALRWIAAGDSPRGHSCLRRRFVSIPPRSFPDARSGGTSLAQAAIDGRSSQPLSQGGQHAMRALLIMVPLIAWFARTAKARGRSPVAWGAVGAASYFLPGGLFGNLLRWKIFRLLQR